jgi:hypothetical protein
MRAAVDRYLPTKSRAKHQLQRIPRRRQSLRSRSSVYLAIAVHGLLWTFLGRG